MSATRTEYARAKGVALRAVHAYLHANGWVPDTEPSSSAVDVYLSPENGPDAAIVPVSTGYADYALRIYQIAEQVGRIEGRSTSSVLTDLSLAQSDLVRLRLPGVDEDNTVKLADGVTVLEEAKGLLLAAACSADRPQRMYRAGRNKKASDYLDGVRLGHTEPGSYAINLLSPVAPSLGDGEALSADPFERKVVRRLVSGLRAAREGVDLVDRRVADFQEFERRLGEGVSANLCRSVARLAAAGGGLEVSVSWAMTRPSGSETEPRADVTFGRSDAAVLNEAARVLADRQERTDEEIQGHVSRLSRGADDPKGTATIRAYVDGKLVSVRTRFEEADYRDITRAHEARLDVSLEGDLVREGQRWRLRNPRSLVVVEDDDENLGT